MNYTHDACYVEDRVALRKKFKDCGKTLSLSVATLESLAGLQTYLETSRARAYLLDGNFPEQDGNFPRLLVGRAIEAIRAKQPNAHITLNSWDSEAIAVARSKNVPELALDVSLHSFLKALQLRQR